MRIKENEMKIIAKIILKNSHRGEHTDIHVEDLATFTIKHNENAVIDYDYLKYQTEKIEEQLINNSLNSIEKTLYDIRLDVKQCEFGGKVYKVKDYGEKKLEMFSKFERSL
ncbi:hypothetical protein [Priestia megaterium]|uniref:hypothetical protein n=1 Tax=Priestia megaterium TaxID=1404 RepID=UPI000EF9CFF1|nr:hypothetical protein [Priestia megaterium]RMA90235.1 hypothetical protein DEU44_2314 [Priestia megaterium]